MVKDEVIWEALSVISDLMEEVRVRRHVGWETKEQVESMYCMERAKTFIDGYTIIREDEHEQQ